MTTQLQSVTIDNLESTQRLSRDLAKIGKTLDRKQARELCDLYYVMQEQRKATGNQTRSMAEQDRANSLVRWFCQESENLENQLKRALKEFADASPLGIWCQSIPGIGPIITAGLMAHIDITKAPTAGHIWRFAGLDPRRKWLCKKDEPSENAEVLYSSVVGTSQKAFITPGSDLLGKLSAVVNISPEILEEAFKDRQTRKEQIAYLRRIPWNASLKSLCWNLGECFVKVSNKDDDIYGHLYRIRKQYEIARNEQGLYSEYALKRAEKVSKSTLAYQSYKEGKLPDGHIHSRAKRYAVKIFLSHYQHVAYRLEYHEMPPKPYAIDILGHAHQIEVPNLNVISEFLN